MVLFFSNQLHQILTWAMGGNIHMLFFILWLGVYFAQLITIMRCELSRRKVITTSYIMDISGGKKINLHVTAICDIVGAIWTCVFIYVAQYICRRDISFGTGQIVQ